MTPLFGGRGRGCDPLVIPEHRPEFDPGQARTAWGALQLAGGLVSAADLRERWGAPGKPLSKQRIHDYTGEPDFPEPVEKRRGGTLWLAAEADAWMRSYIERERRAGPRPRFAGEGERQR